MSADIINLRLARKQKARAEAGKAAAENRVSFGLSKAERVTAKAAKDIANRQLDGHRLSGSKLEDG
ncbi:MAG: DUF4169 family protein [Bosea sp. (in: a-proteobacteria)]